MSYSGDEWICSTERHTHTHRRVNPQTGELSRVWFSGGDCASKIIAMEWDGYYLEWEDGELALEIDPRATSRLIYAQYGCSRIGNVNQTPIDRPYWCRGFEYKYRDEIDAPARKTKRVGVFRGRKRAGRKRRAVAVLLPQPIAEEVTEYMEYGLTVEQWREEARRRYPAEVPAYYRD